jgi:hypothetical protein
MLAIPSVIGVRYSARNWSLSVRLNTENRGAFIPDELFLNDTDFLEIYMAYAHIQDDQKQEFLPPELFIQKHRVTIL